MGMFRISRTIQVAGALAALSLGATACGDAEAESRDDAPADVESAAVTSDGSSQDDTTASSDELDRAGWPDKLVFAAVPSEESSSLEQRFQTTMAVLEDATGVEVEFRQATNYAGVIEGMIAGRIHLAQFGPFSYVIAHTAGADIRPVAAMIDSPDARPGYQSYGITQADNDEINSLEDFAGKNICFVDPGSTSGFLYPSAGLLSVGIDPEKDVNGTFAGGHDASALAVARGDCDAGFAFDDMVDVVLVESGDLTGDELKVVWKSDTIAGSPVAVQNSLPQNLLDIIDTVFTEQVNIPWLVENGYCESEDNCSISDEANWGYVAVEDSFYDGVRNVCDQTKSAQCDPANA